MTASIQQKRRINSIKEHVLAMTENKPKKRTQSDEKMLVALSPIIDIVRTAIWSGRLLNDKPVSILLVADQESAKTEVLKFFAGTSTLKFFSDITSKGLRPFKHDIERKRLRHLVLMDLVRLVSHGKATSERTLQTLATLMEEGESQTSDPGETIVWENFPRIGCLMSITTAYFLSRRAHWRKTGFLTRFIPVSYKYKPTTVMSIHDSISRQRDFTRPSPEKITDIERDPIIPDRLADVLSLEAQKIGKQMETYGFRYHRVFRALAKASALQNARGNVTVKDVDRVLSWRRFFTMDCVEL